MMNSPSDETSGWWNVRGDEPSDDEPTVLVMKRPGDEPSDD